MVRKNGYFVETEKDVREKEKANQEMLKYPEDCKYDRFLFRIFNNPKTRPIGHSANKILRYSLASREPYAIRSNCGGYHPISFNGIKYFVNWDILIKTKKTTFVLEKIKELLADQI